MRKLLYIFNLTLDGPVPIGGFDGLSLDSVVI